ncbi:hypothetical protein CR513_11939, partial [Mucuna pruriens]
MTHISDIKLIRTDTTLDLSQKAEKVCVVRNLAVRDDQYKKILDEKLHIIWQMIATLVPIVGYDLAVQCSAA